MEYQTPHFTKYYMDNRPPNDVYNPSPISFIVVKEGQYRFDFVSKKEDTLNSVKELFSDFLKFYGIGAKTSNGFGRFK
jgi:CRISPR-associated protein Cmr6